MKTCFLFFLIVSSFAITLAQNTSTSSLNNRLKGSEEKVLTYHDMSGSPYRYEEFKESKVYLKSNDTPIDYILNYNANKDQMEYKENNIAHAVTNPNQIKKILVNNEVFVFTSYYNFDDLKEGYFIEIINDYISLYKRELISLQSSNDKAYSSKLEKVRFIKEKPMYYISIYGDPLHLIKNKRKFLDLFFNNPDVENFIKENKIKLHSEADLKELVTFLNNYDKKR